MGWSPILNTLQKILEPLPVRGKGRLSGILFRALPTDEADCHPLPTVTVHVRPGVWIERLMWAGAYERELVDLFKRVLTPGMVALDLGANIGYFSALAAGLVGPTGMVHAFEPSPHCFPRLKKNLAPFHWANASPAAVADAPGSARFSFSELPNETGWGALSLENNGSMQETDVTVVTLDQWTRDNGIRRVDFIKMDLEGSEHRALRGAAQVLNRHRPIVVAELNAVCLSRDGRQPDDVLALLRDAGYDTFAFNEGVLALPEERRDRTIALENLGRARVDNEFSAPVAASR